MQSNFSVNFKKHSRSICTCMESLFVSDSVSVSRQAGKALLEDVEIPHTSIIVHRRCFATLRSTFALIHTRADLLGHFGRSTCTVTKMKSKTLKWCRLFSHRSLRKLTYVFNIWSFTFVCCKCTS